MRADDVVDVLREFYGAQRVVTTDPWEMILLENVAYLVDDATREETFVKLRDEIGLAPKKILAQSPARIANVIEGGGMKPLMRAQKVIDCAKIADEFGVDDPRRFPSIGEPYADRILLFNGKKNGVAPDSNALRVLCRLGFAREQKNYTAMYREAVAAFQVRDARQAHLLLRKHGQELCKRTRPRCEACPLRSKCDWYARAI